jgi:hypothetical protein
MGSSGWSSVLMQLSLPGGVDNFPQNAYYLQFFVSKAADPWIVADGHLSCCSFHFQVGWTTSHKILITYSFLIRRLLTHG